MLRWWGSAKSKLSEICLLLLTKTFSCNMQQHYRCKKLFYTKFYTIWIHKLQKVAALSFLHFTPLSKSVKHHLCFVRRSLYLHAKLKWIEFQHSIKGEIKREKSESMWRLLKHLSLDQLFCTKEFQTLDMSSHFFLILNCIEGWKDASKYCVWHAS